MLEKESKIGAIIQTCLLLNYSASIQFAFVTWQRMISQQQKSQNETT